ncbi:11979_t:CDS:2, partial [Entrophospora sp. SA101]
MPIFDVQEFFVETHEETVQVYVKKSSKNLLIGYIDDYHNLHSTRIPNVTSTSQVAHMATILFDTVSIPPIPYCNENNDPIHNPKGVDASIIKKALHDEYMILLAKIHSYDIDIYEKYGCKFTQTKFVDFVELDLKNTKNYLQAVDSFI